MTPLTLAAAAAADDVVIVTRNDGKEFVGVPVETDEPGHFKILTGRRGRPAILTEDEVDSIEVAA